ncbi:hypothetical protein C8Q75DRAFT_788639 [Abortiporus biennis]|nr:hypothetical protein C8Q75DRAFT_788639 [Abortiporus biennis]
MHEMLVQLHRTTLNGISFVDNFVTEMTYHSLRTLANRDSESLDDDYGNNIRILYALNSIFFFESLR